MRRYTDEALEHTVKKCYSVRAVLRELGLVPAGGNYESVKARIRELSLDTAHFTGQGHLRNKSHTYGTRPISEVLVSGKLEQSFKLKNRLLREGLKARRCEKCQLTEWLGFPVPLELHHRDGDRANNTLSNLPLLCP